MFTFLFSLTPLVAGLEYGLFQYILDLRPQDRAPLTVESVTIAPAWAVLLLYALIFVVYVRRFTRSPTTLLSLLSVVLILFALLMLEVLLAVFQQLFLPLMLPATVMLVRFLRLLADRSVPRLEHVDSATTGVR